MAYDLQMIIAKCHDAASLPVVPEPFVIIQYTIVSDRGIPTTVISFLGLSEVGSRCNREFELASKMKSQPSQEH